MQQHFLENLREPNSGKPLTLEVEEQSNSNILSGTLNAGGNSYPIRNGVPEFVASGHEPGAEQVQQIFSKYWATHDVDFKNPGKRAWYLDALQKLLLLDDQPEKAISNFLNGKKRILDAGCGSGWIATHFRANPEQEFYCVDFGESVYAAAESLTVSPNNFVARASVFELPFPKNHFDLIVSHGVLHHTPDPKLAFERVVEHLAPGGEIYIGMIRRQVPMRNFADQFIREHAAGLSFEDNLKMAKSFYLLASQLQNLNAKINIPAGLEFLGFEPGEQELHQFLHTHLIKCFHRKDLSEEENTMQNIDWYTVRYAWPHTEDELRSWYEAAGLQDIRIWKPKKVSDKHEQIRIGGRKPT